MNKKLKYGRAAGQIKNKKGINRKKILVICQYYKPEPFRISDICEEMVRRGYEVQVVTGYPNYPEGILYDGYGRGKHIDEVINGVKIHRCFTVPRGTGGIKRMLNYFSYAFFSTVYVLSGMCAASDGKPFDIVFCNQLSPVMMACAATAYKKKYGVRTILYCLDLWPESLIAGGIARESAVYRFFHFVSRRTYRKMNKILITSRMFADYFKNEFGIKEAKIEYLPQYAEGVFEKMAPKKENGIFDLMFAGNIGEVQSVETILRAAGMLKTEPVRFHIVGGGTDLRRLKRAGEILHNVIFYGRKTLEEMPGLYAKADAMLVTLKADPVLSLTLPGKVQSYMAACKPVIGAIDGETNTIVQAAACGYCGSAEDAEALAENVKKFMHSGAAARKIMGENARKYYEEHFQKELFMNLLEKNFQ